MYIHTDILRKCRWLKGNGDKATSKTYTKGRCHNLSHYFWIPSELLRFGIILLIQSWLFLKRSIESALQFCFAQYLSSVFLFACFQFRLLRDAIWMSGMVRSWNLNVFESRKQEEGLHLMEVYMVFCFLLVGMYACMK